MDGRVETKEEGKPALSWRARLGMSLGLHSGRVSATPEVESTAQQPTAEHSARRNSNVDLPLAYVPQFETHERRVNNEECPSASSEPALTVPLSLPPQIPHSRSTVSCRSMISQVLPNTEKKFRTLFTVWDTRLSMKLFGSQNGIKKEEERRKNCKHLIIHPCSKFRY